MGPGRGGMRVVSGGEARAAFQSLLALAHSRALFVGLKQARASVEGCSLWEQQGTGAKHPLGKWALPGRTGVLLPYCLPAAGTSPRVSGHLDSGETSAPALWSQPPTKPQAAGCLLQGCCYCWPPASCPQLGIWWLSDSRKGD